MSNFIVPNSILSIGKKYSLFPKKKLVIELTAARGGKRDRADLHIVAHVGPHSGTGTSGLFPEGTVNKGELRLEQVYPAGLWSMERIYTGAGKKCEEKELGERS